MSSFRGIGSVEKPLRSAEYLHVARDFMRDVVTPGGGRGVWSFGDRFLVWVGGKWVTRTAQQMRRELWNWLEEANYTTATGTGTMRYSPNPRKVAGVLEALDAASAAPWVELPAWSRRGVEVTEFDPGAGTVEVVPLPPPETCVAFRDVVVSVEGGVVRTVPRDERWVDVAMVDVEWDPEAKCPRWMRALEEWGEGDPVWGEGLRRMFGYCLMSKRAYAKWFLLQGKSRGGKGVICRILRKLVGDAAWFSSSIADLAGTFGLDGVQHARVMSIPEVSLEDMRDRQTVARIMKQIVGGDEITVNAKHQRQERNVRSCAVPILSGNMIPVLANEASGLSGKMVVVPFTRTFLGHEQFDLEDELRGELAGIAAWAVEGARRLEEAEGRGWQECEAAGRIRLRFRLENNPFDAFLEARCVPNPEGFVRVGLLWREFLDWKQQNGVRVDVPRNRFASDLESGSTWAVTKTKRRVAGEENPQHVMVGLNLSKKVDDEI